MFIFAAAVNAQMGWLAVEGMPNSIVEVTYCLTVLKYVDLHRSEVDEKPVPVPRPYNLALILLVAGILLVGALFDFGSVGLLALQRRYYFSKGHP